MTLLWVYGLITRRTGRLVATALGIAIAVALLASLGSFLSASKATMTQRSVAGVAVDWQVQVQPNRNASAVLRAVRQEPGTLKALPVRFSDSTGLRATAGGTTQTTGPGKVLGLPSTYIHVFPQAVRLLTGKLGGVLVAQQTAANLHVGPGDTIRVGRAGMTPFPVTVSGVVELPQADSLFQQVGVPTQSQPVAPPDNVVLMPVPAFAQAFDPLARSRPDLVTAQIHVRRSHDLPNDPAAAYVAETQAANHLEVVTSGAGIVGDNVGAVLGSAREDALYAQILFLFLGAPGALLAAALTAAVAGAGLARRRKEQALMRARGSSQRQLLRLVMVEATIVGVIGGALGLLAAVIIGRAVFGSASLGTTGSTSVFWATLSFVTGLVVAGAIIVLPARRELRESTARAGLATVGRQGRPRWMRYGLDIWLLAGSLTVFWLTSRNKYTLVLAPEGVPTISVSYWAFLGPVLGWIGAGLLSWRLADLALDRGRPLIAAALRPAVGNLSATVSATMSRQRRTIARSAVLVGLAISFAATTATFNATYQKQAEADAQLTNGADVTVTESPGSTVTAGMASTFARVPGVVAVSPVLHRFAYVGADLQDIYGIQTSTIAAATTLQDPYFQGSSAQQVLARLKARPDGVLVSAETVNDFQLVRGDLLRLRLQDSRTHAYTYVPFHYVGIVNEFPTAPKDSFLVANTSYVATRSGSNAVGSFLVDTGGTNIGSVAQRLRQIVGTSAQVTDLNTTRGLVGSSLTAVDLSGLTKLELGFALVIIAAAGGLVIGLGLTERRRSIAIAAALGGTRRQLRAFSVGEPAFVIVAGLAAGSLSGWGLSEMYVKVLTGVFDPPPTSLAVPWAYLLLAAAASAAAVGGAAWFVARQAELNARSHLREL